MKAKNINRLLAVALTVFAMTACTDESNENGIDSRTPLTVSTSSIVAGRATDNAWQAADAIGVTLFETGTSTIVDGNPLAGKYVTATGDGAFAPADKPNTLYFPTQNKKADIVAFYPYTAIDAALTVPVSVADQSKLSAIDLMVADKVSGKSATDSEVSLTFRHRLVKLDFTIDKTDVSADVDLSKAEVTIDGTPVKAVWNLAEGSLTAADADKASITLPAAYDATDDVLTGTAILVPTAIWGVTLYIKAGEHTFEVPFTDAMKLEAGTNNTLLIHLKQTRATVEATVTDWTTGVTVDLKNLQITVSGTPETPEGSEPTFTAMNLYLADEVQTDYSSANSGALLGEIHTYKLTDGAWTTTNPIYLDELTSDNVIYAMATNSGDVDAVTGYPDNLLAGPVSVKGGAAAIAFRHGLAQLTVKLLPGTGFTPDIADAVITTPAMTRNAALVTDADGYLSYVANGTTTTTYKVASEATHLVVPQTLAKDAVFSVKLANGNTYTVALAEAVTLEAGKNTTLNLTLMPTATAVSVTVAEWGTASASAEVKLAGITTGGITQTAAEGDKLTIAYISGDALAQTATYVYNSGVWTTESPLYWDNIALQDYTKTFTALYAAADGNVSTGIADNIEYGAAINFTELANAMSILTITLQAGEGITDIATEVTGCSVTLLQSTNVEVNTDGSAKFTMKDAVEAIDFTAGTPFYVVPQALTDANTIVLTRENGNKYTIKLSELKDAQSNVLFTDNKIAAGKHYAITLTVNETSVNITATIADWTEVNGSGTVTPEL